MTAPEAAPEFMVRRAPRTDQITDEHRPLTQPLALPTDTPVSDIDELAAILADVAPAQLADEHVMWRAADSGRWVELEPICVGTPLERTVMVWACPHGDGRLCWDTSRPAFVLVGGYYHHHHAHTEPDLAAGA